MNFLSLLFRKKNEAVALSRETIQWQLEPQWCRQRLFYNLLNSNKISLLWSVLRMGPLTSYLAHLIDSKEVFYATLWTEVGSLFRGQFCFFTACTRYGKKEERERESFRPGDFITLSVTLSSSPLKCCCCQEDKYLRTLDGEKHILSLFPKRSVLWKLWFIRQQRVAAFRGSAEESSSFFPRCVCARGEKKDQSEVAFALAAILDRGSWPMGALRSR